MPGIGLVMEGAMQHAPQPGRQARGTATATGGGWAMQGLSAFSTSVARDGRPA
jgi:hypothetical protein